MLVIGFDVVRGANELLPGHRSSWVSDCALCRPLSGRYIADSFRSELRVINNEHRDRPVPSSCGIRTTRNR